jgi:putative ABC transport system permease protein
MPDSKQIYRFLLKLYPARFREEYEAPLERQFRDEYREARSFWGRGRFWLRALSDLAVSIPAEFARELRQDLSYAARVYRRRALVTVLALTALALAIGGATGVFSVLNALLIRSLPFHDPERLADIRNLGIGILPNGQARLDLPANPGFDTATYSSSDMNLSRSGQAARVHVTETSADFFTLLGAVPEFGRSFRADEEVPGKDGVAVIGYGLWQQIFGGDARALGATIRVNGAPLTVVGVAPRSFDYPGKTAVWTPTVFDLERLAKGGAIMAHTIARLKPGVTLARANAIFEAGLRHPNPDGPKGSPEGRPRLVSLQNQLAGPVRQASLVLLAVMAFVLLIACANVAQLLLSRINERRQEMALRAALGASRARLTQQLITESILLTMVAAAAGLAVAYWASRLASSVQPAQLAAQDYSILDWRVLGFAVAVALLTGVLFGVLPAWLMGRTQPTADSVGARAGAQSSGVRRTQAGLVALQAVLTVVLAAGALTMGRSFLKLMGIDLGFRTRNVATATVSLLGSRYESNRQAQPYYGQVLARLRALPGVESAGGADYLPLTDEALMMLPAKLDSGRQAAAVPITITPDFFRSIGTRIVDGRDFTDTDREGAEPVAIVNEEFVRQTGNGAGVLGRTLTSLFNKKPLKIVGVVRNTRFAPSNYPAIAQFYLPAAQHRALFMTFVARVGGKPERYLPLCRDTIQQVDPQIPVYGAKTLDQRLDDALAKPRFYTTAVLFLGGFAVLLAVIGIYGAAAYSITQRTHEIGVRIAVGASPGRLRFALLRQSMLPIAAGMAAGVAGAIALGRFLQYLMDAVEPLDARTCAWAALLLAITAAAAVWTATARVLRVDPMRALRAD